MRVGQPLELREDGGGPRHFLDARPVHCGDVLELQARERVAVDGDGEEVFGYVDRWELVCYEARLDSPPVVALYGKLAGYAARLSYSHDMRFRWPLRGGQ